MQSELPPLSLYIHIPWCIRKCPYCDFNSHQRAGPLPEKNYVNALITELQHYATRLSSRKLESIFIGGGTPSLFSSQAYETIFSAIAKHYSLKDSLEITLEANPGTVEQGYFSGYRKAGINRLSLGVQSLNDTALKKLGRIHDAKTALRAIDTAQQAGFDNLNVDLMFGLPEQTPEKAKKDLTQIIARAPQHISWYQLTLEPQTYFYKHPPILPNDDKIAAIQTTGEMLLAKHNYQQYEISAYAQAGYRCQHNLNYWTFGDYLGIGAGAHSKLTEPNGRIHRHHNHKSPQKYLLTQPNCIAENTIVSDTLLEFMLNAGRLMDTIPLATLINRTGLTVRKVQNALNPAMQQAFLQVSENAISVTPLGHRFLNDLLATL